MSQRHADFYPRIFYSCIPNSSGFAWKATARHLSKTSIRLTLFLNASVESFTTGDRIDLVDTLERGLTLRVTPAGMKTWAVRGRSKDGIAQRVTLGTYPEMKLSIARLKATDTKRQLRETVGHLSQRKKADDSGLDVAPTLEQILNEYEALMAPKRRIWQRTKTGRPVRRITGLNPCSAPIYRPE